MSETHLITGGNGFLGSHLIKRILADTDDSIILLQRSPSTIALDYSERITEVIGDITNRKDIERAMHDASTVLHAGGIAYSNSENYPLLIQTNVMGTTNLLESAVTHNIKRFIYFSSAAIYGDLVTLTMNEDHPIAPLNMYGGTKAAADRLTYAFYRAHNVPAVILRPFNIYGPGQKAPMVIPRFIQRLDQNEEIVLYNSGKQIRDWLYIDDFIDALMLLINAPLDRVVGQAFNISSDEATSLYDITYHIVRLMKKDFKLINPTTEQLKHIETLGCAGDSTKIRNRVQWEPSTTLDDGLRKTIDSLLSTHD